MTAQNKLILIALLLIVVIVALRRGKSRRSKVAAQQQAVQDAVQVLSAALASTNMSYDVGALPLNLTPGERALLVLPLTDLFEVTTATTRRGTWGGPTFRVTKGFWYRLGSSQSVTERRQNIRNVDQGTLVVTNDRLAFIGAVRTISARWNKIIGVDALADAVGVHFEGQNRPIYFQPSSKVSLTYTVGDKEHHLPGDVHVLKAAIDVASRGGASTARRNRSEVRMTDQ